MYSPKISDDLIPTLYRMAKTKGIAMTKLVDQILRAALAPQSGLRSSTDHDRKR